jgi:hypothetical protein
MMPAKVPAEVTRKAFSGRVRCFLEVWLVQAREEGGADCIQQMGMREGYLHEVVAS